MKSLKFIQLEPKTQKNSSRIRSKDGSRVLLDRDNPRTEVTIERI